MHIPTEVEALHGPFDKFQLLKAGPTAV